MRVFDPRYSAYAVFYRSYIYDLTSLITVQIQEGEAHVRGQLAYDDPDVLPWYKYFIP